MPANIHEHRAAVASWTSGETRIHGKEWRLGSEALNGTQKTVVGQTPGSANEDASARMWTWSFGYAAVGVFQTQRAGIESQRVSGILRLKETGIGRVLLRNQRGNPRPDLQGQTKEHHLKSLFTLPFDHT